MRFLVLALVSACLLPVVFCDDAQVEDKTDKLHSAIIAQGKVRTYANALPPEIFRLLDDDIMAVSKYEKSLGTLYHGKKRTRWFSKGDKPRTVIEEALKYLMELAKPNEHIAGVEWWTQVIDSSEPLGFHIDKDESVASNKQFLLTPEWSSVFYVDTAGGGTLIIDQWSPNGNGYEPEIPHEGAWSFPEPNKYLVFDGTLLHGVLPGDKSNNLRKTFLVNYWMEKPEAPNCEELIHEEVPGLRLLSDQEMEDLRARVAANPGPKRHRLPLPKVDLTKGSAVESFTYQVNLPANNKEFVQLPKNTTPGATYIMIWNNDKPWRPVTDSGIYRSKKSVDYFVEKFGDPADPINRAKAIKVQPKRKTKKGKAKKGKAKKAKSKQTKKKEVVDKIKDEL